MIVVIAQPEEIKLVKELGYENNPIIITGVGGVNVIKALKDLPRDTEILNIGYCGSNKLPIKTLVDVYAVGTLHEKAQTHETLMILKNAILDNDVYNCICYTCTDFVEQTNIEIPCVFDMELGFIRAMFPNTRAIKVVSDNLNYKEYKNSTK